MQEPVPKGIKPEIIAQTGHKTEQNITGNLNEMGHASTQGSVSADKSSILEGIKEIGGEVLHDTHDYVDTTLKELGGGATYVREAAENEPLSIANFRQRLKTRLLKKVA